MANPEWLRRQQKRRSSPSPEKLPEIWISGSRNTSPSLPPIQKKPPKPFQNTSRSPSASQEEILSASPNLSRRSTPSPPPSLRTSKLRPRQPQTVQLQPSPAPAVLPSVSYYTQPSDILQFRGDESPEDAEKWLEHFVANTGSFSDSGIFRLLFAKLSAGSPARKWFEGLDDISKSSWMAFQQEFCNKWITLSRILRDEAAWDAFTGHILKEDAIFDEGANDMCSSICCWVDDHVQLAEAVNREDSILIKTTRDLLPPFIQAYLQINFDYTDPKWDKYYSTIRHIPFNVLDLERIRRQISLMDRISAVERGIKDLSEQVKQLVIASNQKGPRREIVIPQPIPPNGSTKTNLFSEVPTSFNGNIPWEPCSPITSVESITTPSSSIISQLATPTAQITTLPDHSQGHFTDPSNASTTVGLEGATDGDIQEGGEQALVFRCPATWRKTQSSMTKKSLISVTQQAINFILTFKADLTSSQASSLRTSATTYDVLTGCHSNKRISIPNLRTNDYTYTDLLEGICGVHSYCAYDDQSNIAESMKTWNYIAEGHPRKHFNVITSKQNNVEDWVPALHIKASGETSMAGGLLSHYDPCTHVSSVRTILFMTLSCHLAECTGEAKHKEFAILSAKCVKTWMIDSETSLIKECLIDASTTVEKAGAMLSCHLTGITIEGFSVLSSVTGDESWKSLAIDMAMAAMHYNGWHGSDGILTVGTGETASKNSDVKAFKGLLNRGLLVAYQRNRSNKVFCHLVRSYINVQCNALLDLSRFKNSYGVDWRGPYVGPYAHAQMAAIDTLVAAIGVNDDEDHV